MRPHQGVRLSKEGQVPHSQHGFQGLRNLVGPGTSARSDSLCEAYDRLVCPLTSVNQVNRIHLLFEERMTPGERTRIQRHLRSRFSLVEAVGLRLRSKLPHNFRNDAQRLRPDPYWKSQTQWEWSRKLLHWKELEPGRNRAGINRTGNGRDWVLYRQESRQNKILVVGFAGASRRMMMSAADFIATLEIFSADFLLLMPNRHSHYKLGVRGFGASMEQTTRELDEKIRAWGYTDLRVIGTSAGSLPALYFGVAAGAQSISLVGVLDPESDVSGIPYPGIREALSPQDSTVRVRITCGSEAHGDLAVARKLAKEIGAGIVVVDGAFHAPLFHLLKKGEFEEWLSRNLDLQRVPCAEQPSSQIPASNPR